MGIKFSGKIQAIKQLAGVPPSALLSKGVTTPNSGHMSLKSGTASWGAGHQVRIQ